MLRVTPLEGSLTLQNSGYLSLFPVGTGGAFSKTLNQNNLLIIKGNDHILIDCGTRAPDALYRLGLPINNIHNYLITHSHADHIGGLEEAMLMGRYVAKRKPNIFIPPDYQEQLWTQSLYGGAAFNERSDQKWLAFDDFWQVIRPTPIPQMGREAHFFNVGSIQITTMRTMHNPDSATSWQDSAYSIGLVIDEKILYTSDTRFDRSLIDFACQHFELEAIFHDVQFFPGGVHASFDDVKTLPESIRNKTWLMHYPDNWKNYSQALAEAGFQGFARQQHFYDFIS